MKRASGILFPVFSLPSQYGIGSFSEEAYDFIDFLAMAGQSYWQVLPLGPTGYGDSPYQSFSTFAGNPYFISPAQLVRDGLLTEAECAGFDFGKDPVRVDYGAMYNSRFSLLKIAYARFLEKLDTDAAEEPAGWRTCPAGKEADTDSACGDGTAACEGSVSSRGDEASACGDEASKCGDAASASGKSAAEAPQRTVAESYRAFCEKNASWLEDYALFMTLKLEEGGKPWSEWPDALRLREASAMAEARERFAGSIGFYCFQQYEFDRQWMALHAYANSRGVEIIGDIPLYVAFDSADAWSHPELYQFDEERKPIVVAGCAPDIFCDTGQLWGNPIYDWDYHEKTGFEWWIRRVARCYELYDVLRIYHFIGLCRYYAIPYEDETAMNGTSHKGPGLKLFAALRAALGDIRIIAEDLGIVTDEVRAMLSESGYPGMRVLQFAFDGDPSNEYLSYNHIQNCVVYTGTHDNTTALGWIKSCSDYERDLARRYTNSIFTDYGQFVWDFIREAFRSVADTCVVPLQDYLVKGDEARINYPGHWGSYWQWRLEPDLISEALAKSIYGLTEVYGRLPKADA